MNYYVVVAFSFSILIPAAIGLVRFHKINAAYYPFLGLLWLGLANELLSFILINNGFYNSVNSNIFYLIESMLITYQFKRWGLLAGQRWLYLSLLFAFVLWWTLEVFYFSRLTTFASFFIIFYAFVLTLLSVAMINQLTLHVRGKLVKHATFLLCLGMVVYFTNAILVESSYVYGANWSTSFKKKRWLGSCHLSICFVIYFMQ